MKYEYRNMPMIIQENKEKEKWKVVFSSGDNHDSKGTIALLETTFLNHRVSKKYYNSTFIMQI